MYYPYLRGKQQELKLLRDYSDSFHSFCKPIIEPVSMNQKNLLKATDILKKERLPYILIATPINGELKNFPGDISQLWDETITNNPNCEIGLVVSHNNDINKLKKIVKAFPNNKFVLIHIGIFPDQDYEVLKSATSFKEHIFCLDYFAKDGSFESYQNKFTKPKIAIKDGFVRQPKNKDYPQTSQFSNLHNTYASNFSGYGDYLVEGVKYRSGGGGNPTAEIWATVHLTLFHEDLSLFVNHYLSDTNSQNGSSVGEMIQECFGKIVSQLQHLSAYPNQHTSGLRIIREYYMANHLTNFAKLKYITFIHHIEVMKNYLNNLEFLN